MAQALPHRRRLGVADASTIVDRVARVGDLLDPIAKAAHELAVVVREARREVERSFRTDRSDRTRGDAELAFEAGVVVDGMVVVVRVAPDEDGAEEDEVAE